MGAPDDDWRLTGQEQYLLGAELVRKPYRARSERWEHEHCEFCWAKFMDPEFSAAHRQFIEDNPDVLTEGYATTATESDRADYHWICPPCFDDFVERFQWRVAETAS